VTTRVVVVGASLAGATAAVRLRALGFGGEVTLVGAEPHLPYERPGLSKGYLTGELAKERLLVHQPEVYGDNDVQLRLGTRARGLDVERRRVLLDDGDLPYDVAVIATGSANVRPPIPGMDLAGVHQLRTIEDADALRAAAAAARSAVVVGTGFIGCEIAATLRGLGLDVTAVDGLPGPLWSVLGPQLSELVRGWHDQHGVTVLGGVGVESLEGAERVDRVRLADGRVLPADLVVVGVGARPVLDWLDDAPLHRAAGGLGVDDAGRTSADGVYAIGDVAAQWYPDEAAHRRTEHYSSALAQGDRAAHAIAGVPLPAQAASWFWTDQYDHTLHYAGRSAPGDELVLRPEPLAGFYLREGLLTGVVTVDNGRDFRRATKLIGRRIDPAVLADPAADLRTVA
jgi:3-phenylpropionate/trans-cinnamate dioxygenase ferredoxin reductase subunit